MLESAESEIMVRASNIAGEPVAGALERLVMDGFDSHFDEASENHDETELLSSAREFLENNGVDVSTRLLWEIDAEADGQVIRLVGTERAPDEPEAIDGVAIEYLTQFDRSQAVAMLGYFDYCKKEGKWFLGELHARDH